MHPCSKNQQLTVDLEQFPLDIPVQTFQLLTIGYLEILPSLMSTGFNCTAKSKSVPCFRISYSFAAIYEYKHV